MKILLTKRLADAMAIKPAAGSEETNPFFSWTANWVNTFDRRKEDMVVMVNNATRFTVTIYGVKHNQFKNIEAKMIAAIRNTLLARNVNSEVIDEYFKQAGTVEFGANHDRKMTTVLNHQALRAALVVGGLINNSREPITFNDTFGDSINDSIMDYGKPGVESYYPYQKMLDYLRGITNKPIYQYPAFELLVTLDLECYKATRRLVVPAELTFSQLHEVLQKAFMWKNCHLYDFFLFDGESGVAKTRLVATEVELEEGDDATVLMAKHRLSEYLPENNFILYTYDMGDSWEHQIELVRELKAYDKESPYLLEAAGQTPPEDVGGVGGFLDFREIMLNPHHPEYADTKEWVGYWSPELEKYDKRPRPIHI